MNKLFNKEDVLTVITCDCAKVGDKGYFSDNLRDLNNNVKRGEVHSLVKIHDEDFLLYSFEGDHHRNGFALFLPADKVKKKEPTYRPFRHFMELFDFLMSNFDAEHFDIKKADTLLDQEVTLKRKKDSLVCTMKVEDICLIYGIKTYLSNDSHDNFLKKLFDNFEIKKNGEWVPFGIKEE